MGGVWDVGGVEAQMNCREPLVWLKVVGLVVSFRVYKQVVSLSLYT